MMAEEENGSLEEGKGKKKPPVLLIIIAVVALLLIAAIAIFAMVLTSSDEPKAGGGAAKSKGATQMGEGSGRVVDVANIGPIYDMDDFTVNLLNENGKRYLRTKLNLELDSEDLLSEVERKVPVIRDYVIQVLSSKRVEEITTRDGKERVKDELVKVLNTLLIDGQVKNVYFITFVIQ